MRLRIRSNGIVAVGMEFVDDETGEPVPGLVVYEGTIHFKAGDIIKATLVVESCVDVVADTDLVEVDGA